MTPLQGILTLRGWQPFMWTHELYGMQRTDPILVQIAPFKSATGQLMHHAVYGWPDVLNGRDAPKIQQASCGLVVRQCYHIDWDMLADHVLLALAPAIDIEL